MLNCQRVHFFFKKLSGVPNIDSGTKCDTPLKALAFHASGDEIYDVDVGNLADLEYGMAKT